MNLPKNAAHAAYEYAHALAPKDDARFVLLFWTAYYLSETARPDARPVYRLPLPFLRSYAPLLAYTDFARAARAEIMHLLHEIGVVGQPPQFRVVGPPELVDPPDCVVMRLASSTEFTCSAAILGEQIAVTAGHCLNLPEEDVVLFTGPDIHDPQGGIFLTGRAIRHPKFSNTGSARNDIAVIHLDTPTDIAPAPRSFDPQIGDLAFNTGYGKNDPQATVGFGIRRTVRMTVATVDTTELIAGPNSLAETSGSQCRGDSGGPLYIARNGVLTLTAIASRSIGVIPCGAGGFYTLLGPYQQFLGI